MNKERAVRGVSGEVVTCCYSYLCFHILHGFTQDFINMLQDNGLIHTLSLNVDTRFGLLNLVSSCTIRSSTNIYIQLNV